MFEKLEEVKLHYEEISEELSRGTGNGSYDRFRALLKEQAELRPVMELYLSYRRIESDIKTALLLLESENDETSRSLLKAEISEGKEKLEETAELLKKALLPKDPNDGKNIVLEIRAGAGGDEAGLFASELYRMYVHFAEINRFRVETVEYNESGIGGASKITAIVTGKGAYSLLKYESGVHRVQRVPKTETQGRIHTSTATVAVFPEAEEVDVQINMEDCRFDVFRASGNGGQCVNTTDSAVRLTHYPTGIVISCQDEKSQLKNRDKALKVLRAKLYELELRKKAEESRELRLSLVGTGDRSEKIRTYNFPQGRVTDHRINLTLYRINEIINGDMEELIQALITAEQGEKLQNSKR